MKKSLPLPGMRIIKSVPAVFLCFAVYEFRGRKGIPFYSALAVLQCMQPYTSSALKTGLTRSKGTLIGALWGCIALLLILKLPLGSGLLIYLCLSLFVGLVLYSTVLLKCKDTAYFSCVVFLSIVVNHIGDENPYLFVLNRVLDTMIGILLGLAVNAFHLPRKRHNEILFVSGIDETILDMNDRLSDYSRVELNRLIDSGCRFTVSTTETPATVRELLEGVRLPLPIIAMDGAVLYDLSDRKYLKKTPMAPACAADVLLFLRSRGFHPFINTVEEDLLVIYYDMLANSAQEDIFERRRKSPYRNYVCRASAVTENVLYFFLIDTSDRIDGLMKELNSSPARNFIRIVREPSKRFEGYAWIKIYDRDATRDAMLSVLRDRISPEKVITFGSIKDRYDVYISDPSKDRMVRRLQQLYEPISLFLQKHDS